MQAAEETLELCENPCPFLLKQSDSSPLQPHTCPTEQNRYVSEHLGTNGTSFLPYKFKDKDELQGINYKKSSGSHGRVTVECLQTKNDDLTHGEKNSNAPRVKG